MLLLFGCLIMDARVFEHNFDFGEVPFRQSVFFWEMWICERCDHPCAGYYVRSNLHCDLHHVPQSNSNRRCSNLCSCDVVGPCVPWRSVCVSLCFWPGFGWQGAFLFYGCLCFPVSKKSRKENGFCSAQCDTKSFLLGVILLLLGMVQCHTCL